MNKIGHFFKSYHLPIISGIFVGTSFIPFAPWALAFCYVPLWFWIFKNQPTLKQVFWGSWITQFILTLIGFHWIAFTAHEFGNLPWIASIPVLLIFAGFAHLYIPLAHWLSVALTWKLKLNKSALFVLFPSLIALGEIFWPSIFQWNLGYPLLWVESPLAQWADTVGFQGLSFAVLLINAGILFLWLKKDKMLWAAGSLVTIGLLLTFYFGGLKKAEHWSKTDSEIKVLQVQANIGNLERRYAERGVGFQQTILEDYANLTRQGLKEHPDTELVVWPESAFPDLLNRWAQDRKYPTMFIDFVKEIKKPIFTGAYSKDPPEHPTKRKDYNAVFLLDQNAELLSEPYHKSQLLIFGEYLPLVETFPFLAKINPGGSGFGRGPGPSIMKLGDFNIGPQICYESLYPDFSAGLAKLGADLLINVTNDSWFGPRFEPYQHLYMTLARGLEVRRPLIRNTNTGVSSVILANGQILEKSNVYTEWYGFEKIPYLKNAPQSFFTKFGAWLWAAILLLVLATLLITRQKK